jgi:hypothetical protein
MHNADKDAEEEGKRRRRREERRGEERRGGKRKRKRIKNKEWGVMVIAMAIVMVWGGKTGKLQVHGFSVFYFWGRWGT